MSYLETLSSARWGGAGGVVVGGGVVDAGGSVVVVGVSEGIVGVFGRVAVLLLLLLLSGKGLVGGGIGGISVGGERIEVTGEIGID